ncbi:MAG: hypothetical protein NVS1B2_12550 [Vulcanimicrobiaceae bacterium]
MIYFRNTTRTHRVDERRVTAVARTLLAATGRPGAALSLTLVGDYAMRRINREHRGKDRTTDVLSFPFFEPFAVPKQARRGEPELLVGDVVISIDAAARQARDYDATLAAEIDRLLVHAVAHLMGHDHELPDERTKMVRAEKRLAAAIGLAWPYRAPSDGRTDGRRGTRSPACR